MEDHYTPGAPTVLCPELVGREQQVGLLRQRTAGLHDGDGGVVAVVGTAGVGKSRLVREATAGTSATVLWGRAVPAENPVPYRPLAEALLAASRARPRPDDPSLAGFDGHLARLVPAWGTGTTDATADESPLLLGEAVVRLLAVLAREQGSDEKDEASTGCVLVLEDLHWADPETLAVVEYLADALRDQPVLCLGTTRSDEPAARLLEGLARQGAADVVPVDPLDDAGVDRMLAACLATTDPPAEVRDLVHTHGDGNPFLVEELLAGLVAAGALRRHDGWWQVDGPITPAVPASLRDSIARRLAAFDPTTRRVLGAASLLGRRFEWELLPGIADVDARTAADALRAAVDGQLVEADGDDFRFRHALTREAVLADLLPPERRELATRAWPAVERAHPGLPGPTCQLAADLAEAAGDPATAAARLVTAAKRALHDGALASAESTARRARQLARADDDRAADHSDAALDADEALVHVLAAAGKSGDALSLGRQLAEQLRQADAPAERRADLLVALVRAAVAAGDLDAAAETVDEARTAAGSDPDPALLTRLDAVAAEVALDRADLELAEQLCHRAIDGARATDQAAVHCEALLLLGRVTRPRGLADARASFQEAARVAEHAGLPRWHLRARHELALEGFDVGDFGPMRATRDLAARYGAHLTVAAMELALADAALSDFDREECLRAATACVEASRRYGLAAEPVAQLWLAGAHALAGDDDAMHAAVEAALAKHPDDPRILGDLYGRVLVTRAFVRDELDELPRLLDEMMTHVRRAPPTTSVYPSRVFWVLVHTLDDDDLGEAARAEFHATTSALGLPLFGIYGEVAEALALGRSGDGEAAQTRLAPAYEAICSVPVGAGMTNAAWLLVAGGAIRDGWGDPVAWLRAAEAFFVEHGYDRLVRRARALLREAGAPVPRRGRGTSEVPESLRALGVTSREVDVLKLVVAGRTTKQIAAELYLSPKTVERHLGSLFDRTGVRNRQALAEVGAAHLS